MVFTHHLITVFHIPIFHVREIRNHSCQRSSPQATKIKTNAVYVQRQKPNFHCCYLLLLHLPNEIYCSSQSDSVKHNAFSKLSTIHNTDGRTVIQHAVTVCRISFICSFQQQQQQYPHIHEQKDVFQAREKTTPESADRAKKL